MSKWLCLVRMLKALFCIFYAYHFFLFVKILMNSHSGIQPIQGLDYPIVGYTYFDQHITGRLRVSETTWLTTFHQTNVDNKSIEFNIDHNQRHSIYSFRMSTAMTDMSWFILLILWNYSLIFLSTSNQNNCQNCKSWYAIRLSHSFNLIQVFVAFFRVPSFRLLFNGCL